MSDAPKFTLDTYEQALGLRRTRQSAEHGVELRVYEDGGVVIAEGEDTVTLTEEQAAWLAAELAR